MATRASLRRALALLGVLLLCWSVVVVVTGGIGFRYGPIRFSSRASRNPLVLALISLVGAVIAAPRGRRLRAIAVDGRWLSAALSAGTRRAWTRWERAEAWLQAVPSSAAPAVAAVVAVAITVFGFTHGAFVAASADAWGYVSQAHLWASATLLVEQPLMAELSAQVPRSALAPLAYRPAPDGAAAIVPVVAPGFPMLMALFERAGGRGAVFYAQPLSAGIAILAAYALATRIGGRWSGTATALLLAASPSFIFQLTGAPMSDIPAAMWWTLSLALTLGSGRASALLAGLAASAAILTRTNLAPAVAVPTLLLAAVAIHTRAVSSLATQRLALFVAGVLPAVAIVPTLNSYWYGSPLSSGYGEAGQIFHWANVAQNLVRYPTWLLETQTAVILLAAAAPLIPRLRARRREALMLLAFVLAVGTAYLAYDAFEDWWYLRFLLPAYGAALALTCAALVAGAMRLPAGLRVVPATLVVACVAWHGLAFGQRHAIFDTTGEQRYATTGRYVAEHLPERAVLISMLYSGSARYYSGRVTVRYTEIPPDKLDWVVTEVRRHGYEPYALLEEWEAALFRAQFKGQRALAALDAVPVATLPSGPVLIYQLSPQ
jgi:hypothetical protein